MLLIIEHFWPESARLLKPAEDRLQDAHGGRVLPVFELGWAGGDDQGFCLFTCIVQANIMLLCWHLSEAQRTGLG